MQHFPILILNALERETNSERIVGFGKPLKKPPTKIYLKIKIGREWQKSKVRKVFSKQKNEELEQKERKREACLSGKISP